MEPVTPCNRMKSKEQILFPYVMQDTACREVVTKKGALEAIQLFHDQSYRELPTEENYKAKYEKCIDVIKRFDAGIIGMYNL